MDFTKKFIYIETYGCQQNEADSERIAGIAKGMGFSQTQSPDKADLIIINTCAIREHAELKALSNTGRFKHLKAKKPSLRIGVCGCMVQQERRVEDMKHKYPYVDFVFGTNMFEKVEEIIRRSFTQKKRQLHVDSYDENPGTVCEGLPVQRRFSYKAYVSVMSGCNNFCSYCIVPYVRGRERSRKMELILQEVQSLVENGYKEITLLGQNVNSYGKDLGLAHGFAQLLRRINDLPGDFIIRFMTSHPKDASQELIDALAQCEKCAPHFHLPLQSGNSRVLEKMNRKYTREDFLSLVQRIRAAIPQIALTSDIIVGFPGETEEEFCDTLSAMETVKFDNVFSFVYSPRNNTPAALMPDQIEDAVKKERMKRLLDLQQNICLEKNKAYVGRVVKALCEGRSKSDPDMLSARTLSGKLIHFKKETDEDWEGKFVNLEVTRAMPIMLLGKMLSPCQKEEEK